MGLFYFQHACPPLEGSVEGRATSWEPILRRKYSFPNVQDSFISSRFFWSKQISAARPRPEFVYYFYGMPKPLFFVVVILFFSSCASQERLIEGKQRILLQQGLRYYLSFPEKYFEETDTTFGLLLFLHGGGDSGRPLNELTKNGPPKMMADGYPFPFLVLAPQNPYERKWWDIRAVNQLLDSIVSQHRVDKKRIFLTGLSRGGSAAWEMAVQYPDKFAALAVVCGMAPVPYAHWLNKDMPIWVFHGVEDKVIPVNESDDMVGKLREMGFQVKYDRYEGVGHNSWNRAYANDELYQWMNRQKLRQ